MRLMRAVLGLLALSVLVAGLAVACGGDGESEKPAAVTSPEGVVREFASGSAKAKVKVVPLVPVAGGTEGTTFTFEGGDCGIGGYDEWLGDHHRWSQQWQLLRTDRRQDSGQSGICEVGQGRRRVQGG